MMESSKSIEKIYIFLCWAGEESRKIAKEVKVCLLDIFGPSIDIFFSEQNIAAGHTWNWDLTKELEVRDIGILCLTPNNVDNVYIHFEAGALSKHREKSLVIPLLFQVTYSELKGPLISFQSVPSDNRDKVLENFLKELNSHLNESRQETTERLQRAVDNEWQKVLEVSQKVLASSQNLTSLVIQEDGVDVFKEEVLALTREIHQEITPLKEMHNEISQVSEYLENMDSKWQDLRSEVDRVSQSLSILYQKNQKQLATPGQLSSVGFDSYNPKNVSSELAFLVSSDNNFIRKLWNTCRDILKDLDLDQKPIDALQQNISQTEWEIDEYAKLKILKILEQCPKEHDWFHEFRKELSKLLLKAP